MPQLNRVVAAVIRDQDRWLICQRPRDKRHGGLWEFPGGKVLPGESDAEALDRELTEELQVQLAGCGREVYRFQEAGSEFVIAFIPASIDGTPRCTEHSDMRWASLGELHELPLAPSDAQFAHWLSEHLALGSS